MSVSHANPDSIGPEPVCLETASVTVRYRSGKHSLIALHDVSIRVPMASFGLLRGASGSGKSTLLGVMGAMIRPSAGKVFINNQEITQASSRHLARMRRRLGFVFQNLALLPRISAWENVALPLIADGVPFGERRQRAEELLTRFGLAERMESTVTELSGGEQQRVAFARALAGSPDIFLADEPTASLDDESADYLASTLTQMHHQGLTVLVASHDDRFNDLATHTWDLIGGRATSGKT